MRVVVVEDHEMIRQGLCSLLPAVVGAQVIGHASNGRDAVRLLTTLSPDVVLMDITMPGLNGIEATRQITLRDPHLKVIALSSHSDRQTIARFIEPGQISFSAMPETRRGRIPLRAARRSPHRDDRCG